MSLHAVDQLRPSTSRVLPAIAATVVCDGPSPRWRGGSTFRIDGVLRATTGVPELDFHTGDDQGRRTPGEQRGHAEQPAREVHAQDRRDQGDEREHVVLVFKLDAVAAPQRRTRPRAEALDPGLRAAPRRDALRGPRREDVPQYSVEDEQRELDAQAGLGGCEASEEVWHPFGSSFALIGELCGVAAALLPCAAT